jgi:transcriptional regulator NrdR family protein
VTALEAPGLRPWRRRRAQQATKHRRFRHCLKCSKWFAAYVTIKDERWACERQVCYRCLHFRA